MKAQVIYRVSYGLHGKKQSAGTLFNHHEKRNDSRFNLTMERAWTEPNQIAMISYTILSADQGFFFGAVSIIH